MDSPHDTYKIIRFYEHSARREVVRTGLTLAEATEHCTDPKTHGKGWFDGRQKEASNDRFKGQGANA